MAFGMNPHTDPNFITILYQDDVGGLQVCRQDGKWVAIEPHAEAFVINVGESLQAWTNDIYPAGLHRAVVNAERARLSMAFFHSPAKDILLNIPNELVSEDHPLKYRSFKWGEYDKWVAELAASGQPPSYDRTWLSRISLTKWSSKV
eukprot:c54058_g1_i1 orf=2-442(+)